MRFLFNSIEVREKFKVSQTDWSRKRVLEFCKVTVLVLYNYKSPIQNKLNRFYKIMGKIFTVPTSSAYTQARKKLKPEFYEFINTELINNYYETFSDEEDKEKGYLNGRRLLGLDGSIINLPDTDETRKRYNLQPCGIAGKERVQGLGSFLYDLLNELVISVSLEEKKSEEKFLFEKHKTMLKTGDIITMDRAYASYRMLSFCSKNEIDYIIRFSKQSFKEVNAFLKSKENQAIVEIPIREAKRALIKEEGLEEKVILRLMKIVLPTGEIEILGTSLLDEKEYPLEMFKELYHKRWGIETYFNRIKNIYELERFSSLSLQNILQDFFGIIFLSNIESIVSKEAEEELKEENKISNSTTEYGINHSVSYSSMIDYSTELFVDQRRDIEEVLIELKHFLKMNPILKRPGRSSERKELSANEKIWHLKYNKKIP